MSVLIKTDLPLEKNFQKSSIKPSNYFPDRNKTYWNHYIQIKQWIADKYYQNAAAGLSRSGIRYTKHDISHVDDVIMMAGNILGHGDTIGSNDKLINNIAPYEIYVLLFAILLHDAGNAIQRDKHEKAPKKILKEMGELSGLEPLERRLIASIAEAHGGQTEDGNKDTITNTIQEDTSTISNLSIKARMLAAVLRLADELSENPTRCDPQALRIPYNSPDSVIHNLYCKIIDTKIDYSSRTIFLSYLIDKKHLEEKFLQPNEPNNEIYLVDFIAKRIVKCDRERRYCNRFMFPGGFDRIRVKMEIHDDNDAIIDTISKEISESGYPGTTKQTEEIESSFNGSVLYNKYFNNNVVNSE